MDTNNLEDLMIMKLMIYFLTFVHLYLSALTTTSHGVPILLCVATTFVIPILSIGFDVTYAFEVTKNKNSQRYPTLAPFIMNYQ